MGSSRTTTAGLTLGSVSVRCRVTSLGSTSDGAPGKDGNCTNIYVGVQWTVGKTNKFKALCFMLKAVPQPQATSRDQCVISIVIVRLRVLGLIICFAVVKCFFTFVCYFGFKICGFRKYC